MSYTFHTEFKAKAISYGSTRAASAIKYLVYHYTGNKTDKAVNNAKYYANTNTRQAGAHYFVDDTTVYQSIDDLRIAWAVGGNKYSDCATTGGGKLYKICTNTNSISIEMCSTNGAITEATMANAIELGKMLMKKYNIPLSNVCTHFDVSGKHCVGWIGWWGSDRSKWNAFKARLSSTSTSTSSSVQTQSTPDGYIKVGQIHGNNFTGSSVLANGIRDDSTKKLGIKVLQQAMNADYKSNLKVDGIWGPKSQAALSNHYVASGAKQYLCTACCILLLLRGYHLTLTDNPMVFDQNMFNAVAKFQTEIGIRATGRCDAATFIKLIS